MQGIKALGEYHYYLGKNKYEVISGIDIEGDKINTIQEWYALPNKYNIMCDAYKYREHLHKITRSWIRSFGLGNDLGLIHIEDYQIRTPILEQQADGEYISNMQHFISVFESIVKGRSVTGYYVPKCLIQTEPGYNLVCELKNAKYSRNVLCHNALCYKSFVLKNNQLHGITNWRYAGYYPPEFENIISKYLVFLF
ncbi:hypothetical protein CONCODRAFT_8980 [Conidiobolus coronatus NRRL 28638]|uniref:Uncharacterized protein n=1 Tax=Conidiobolus coronatus (strain ATCC 28846 / CBS 209.66 / NRRL 28638) TaxID=796925 RepID=A0A137P1A7_CONC2|nr:hypothetical protein CONCODRAFT_8980 [Conidiobolus coronatus NRRL 28638]|eukprot:KXN68659.1 hypothetical protein CONCODRAFT_8980 [Conidiobolus coronatus NRRL 28638]